MNVSDVRMGRWMGGSRADEKACQIGGSWGQRRK